MLQDLGTTTQPSAALDLDDPFAVDKVETGTRQTTSTVILVTTTMACATVPQVTTTTAMTTTAIIDIVAITASERARGMAGDDGQVPMPTKESLGVNRKERAVLLVMMMIKEAELGQRITELSTKRTSLFPKPA
jgi:hypothetical protein